MDTSPDSTREYAKLFAEKRDKILADYFEFLSIPTISAQAEYKESIQKGAHWVQRYLNDSGFRTEIWETSGHPTVFGEWNGAPGKPTVLFYGHYDVQPVDPVQNWSSPPFTPTVRDGKVFARGAQDNKGQIFYTLAAIRELLRSRGTLPLNVKFVIEGEEEIGSPGLGKIAAEKSKLLAADHIAVVDVETKGENTPSIVLGVRGLVAFTIEAYGPSMDLHSGTYGGLVYNPARAIAEIVASLHTDSGRVAIPGFYDRVRELSEADKKLLDLEFDSAEFERFIGVPPLGGEQDQAPLIRSWLRPTAEVNGLYGGYSGGGSKTVIPQRAGAKLTFRLVADQNPQEIAELVRSFIQKRTPKGVKLDITFHEGAGQPLRTSAESVVSKAAFQTYSELFGKPCRAVLTGGSIPVVTALAQAAKGEVVLIGQGLDSDRIHAPDENFGLNRFERGFLTICRFSELLGQSK